MDNKEKWNAWLDPLANKWKVYNHKGRMVAEMSSEAPEEAVVEFLSSLGVEGRVDSHRPIQDNVVSLRAYKAQRHPDSLKPSMDDLRALTPKPLWEEPADDI